MFINNFYYEDIFSLRDILHKIYFIFFYFQVNII